MTRENDIHKSSSMGTQSRATCSHTVWGSFRARGECSGQTLAAEAVQVPLWPSRKEHAMGPWLAVQSDFYYRLQTQKEQSSKNNFLTTRENPGRTSLFQTRMLK